MNVLYLVGVNYGFLIKNKKMKTVEQDFEAIRNLLITNKDWRLGQAIFNYFSDINLCENEAYVEMTKEVIGTNSDCFYQNKNIIRFIHTIYKEENYKIFLYSNLGQALYGKYK